MCPAPGMQHVQCSSVLGVVQTYSETAQQPGFDGPYLIELSIMLLLSKVSPQLSSSPAYRHYFHDLRGPDLDKAKQLNDPFMLIKFKVRVCVACLESSVSLQPTAVISLICLAGRRSLVLGSEHHSIRIAPVLLSTFLQVTCGVHGKTQCVVSKHVNV